MAQGRRARPAGFDPRAVPCGAGVCSGAGAAGAGPGLAWHRRSGAADRGNVPVLTRAAQFGLLGGTKRWDLEHVACWGWHRLRLKCGVKWLKFTSHKQLQKTFPVSSIKAPAQEWFRWKAQDFGSGMCCWAPPGSDFV